MESYTTIVIVIAVLFFDFIVVMMVMRMKKARQLKTAALITAAAGHEGWQPMPATPNQLYRLQGTITPGITWEISSQQRKKSTSRSESTLWQTTDVRLPEKVIALWGGTSINTSMAEVDLGHPVVKLALQRVFGKNAAAALAQASIVEIPNKQPSDNFTIFSNDDELAKAFMTDPLPSILHDWRSAKMPNPNLILWSDGMQVRFAQKVEDVESLRKVVTLCEALALRGKEVARMIGE